MSFKTQPDGGITADATNNTLQKGDGTNLVDSQITDTGSLITLPGAVTFSGDLQLLDNSAAEFGSGSDSRLYYNGTDTFWDLRAAGTGDLMVALAGSFPSPDPGVHIWRGNAGAVTAISNAGLVIENSAATYIHFLTPNSNTAGILWGDPEADITGGLIYNHSTDALTFRLVDNTDRLLYSAGAFAFQEATTVSTPVNTDLTLSNSGTGNIILTPGGDVLIQSTTDSVTGVQILDLDGGLPVFNVDTVNERVGIGTAAPQADLDIGANVTVSLPRLRLVGQSSSSWLFELGDGTGAVYLRFNRNASNVLKIDASGRLDIASVGTLTLAGNGGTSDPDAGVEYALKVLGAGGKGMATHGDSIFISSNVGFETTTPTNTISLGGNSARTMWMERHTTADTAGNDLTVQGGGATAGATDKDGGDHLVSSGISTGTGTSKIEFYTAPAGGSGTSDNAPTLKVTIDGAGNFSIGNAAASSVLHVDSNAANTVAIATLENTAGDIQVFRTDVDPETVVTGSIGDLVIDGTGGELFIKNTGSATNTGWVAVGGGTEAFITHSVSDVGNSGTHYVAGFYEAPAAHAVLTIGGTVTQTLGTAGQMDGAHAFVVASGAGGTDLVLTVTGVSITEAGVRNGSDSEIIVADTDTASVDDYFETTKKWLGQVTYTLTGASGAFTFNYGYAKYDDYGNQNIEVNLFEMTLQGGASETGFNVELLHHKATGWTYHASAFVPGTTAIVSSLTDYTSTNDNFVSNGHVAYKRTGLSTAISGSTVEGTIIRLTTAVNNSIDYANFTIGIIVR